jgi:hypothetical protein
MMGRTLGIHWAATTFGTWLHGDPRGSWFEGRLIGPDSYLEAAARASMSSDAVILSATEQLLVANALGEIVIAQKHRVYAASVQATHIHLVFAPLRENITPAIARLKRRSAMEVLARRRDLGLSPVPRTLWTAGKFPRFIFDESHLANAIEYVRDHNRRLGLPPDPYDWIEPLYAPGKFVGERVRRDLSERLWL